MMMISHEWKRSARNLAMAAALGAMLFSSCTGFVQVPGAAVEVMGDRVLVDTPLGFVSVGDEVVQVDLPGFGVDLQGDFDIDVDWH